MNDKDVRGGGNHATLLEIDLSVAAITLIVIDDLALNLLLQRLLDRLEALDRQGEVEVVLHTVLDLAALLADHLVALFAAKHTLDEVLAGGGLQGVLQSVEEDIEELLGVLLLGDIGG